MEIGKRRKKAVRVFLGFLGVMGVCTGVSRGIYAYQMPQVETGRAAGKSISHEVSVSGVVEAARERDVVVAEGVRVREICVKVGEKVEKGKVLMRVDVADLEELTQDVGEKIKLEEGKIAAARYARENNVAFLGICLGLQAAVCEFARNVAGMCGRCRIRRFLTRGARMNGRRRSGRSIRRVRIFWRRE